MIFNLTDLGLADLGAGPLDVVVGGLGLGYTARAVLDHPGTGSLLVIDALAAVFESCAAHVVRFHNPLQNREATNTVYVARTRA